ncbi:YfcC family protein [Entomoplasma freundtii]
MLSAFSILMLIILVLVIISWILYWAKVETTVKEAVKWDENTGEVIQWQDTAKRIQAMGIVDLFIAPMKGFIEKSGVIIFILILGAFIYMVISSKALEGMSQAILVKMKGKEIWAIIPLMTFFSLAGTTEGMAEESLGFYMIMIPLMIAAGFDTFTGLLIVLVGAGAGVLASTVNPFVITVALDGLGKDSTGAALTAGDGLVWRLVSWVIITAIAITYVMLYAWQIKRSPQKSITFSTKDEDYTYFLKNSTQKIKMDWRRRWTIAIFAIVFVIMIIYLVGWDQILRNTAMADAANWIRNHIPYLAATVPGFGNGSLEIVAGFFLIGAIVVGMINLIGAPHADGLDGEQTFLKEFMAGASDILSVCLVIATAAGVGYILRESYMQDLFVRGLSNSIGNISSGIGKVIVLYLIFLPLSFLIPSTSGFAAAVFPLLSGVVQTSSGTWDPVAASGSVTAFSFASGLINFITPTSGVVMGAIAIARVDYGRFIKGIMPLVGIIFAASIGLLAIGGAIGSPIA